MAYTNVWNETTPTGAEAANTIDDLFRSFKLDLRERLGTIFGLSSVQFAADPILPNSLNLAGGTPSKIFAGTFINIRDSADTQNLVSINGATGETIVGYNTMASTASIKINAAANTQKRIGFTSAGVDRWGVTSSNTTESGSDAGSDFFIRAYTDAGSIIDNPLTITRATGGFITITRNLVMGTAVSRIIPGATSLSLRNNANSADNLIILDNGNVAIRGTLTTSGGISYTSGSVVVGAGANSANITLIDGRQFRITLWSSTDAFATLVNSTDRCVGSVILNAGSASITMDIVSANTSVQFSGTAGTFRINNASGASRTIKYFVEILN